MDTQEWTNEAHQLTRRKAATSHQARFFFHLPLISDKLNSRVRQILKRNNINARVVNPKPRTILQMAKKSPASIACRMRCCPIPYVKCTSCFVVYEGRCNACNKSYIGSTSRSLHHRAREHIILYAASKKDGASAFGDHCNAYHLHQEPNITFSIIKSTVRDELHLRIAEAYEIQSRRPALNRKREDMGTGFLAWHDHIA